MSAGRYKCAWLNEAGRPCVRYSKTDSQYGYCDKHSKAGTVAIDEQLCRKIDAYWRARGVEAGARQESWHIKSDLRWRHMASLELS